MPRIVDYATVRDRMLAGGFVSLYHNSGAFGFARGADWKMRGWIGPEDPTVRLEVRPYILHVDKPYAANLAANFVAARRRIRGDAWLMPKSHWHFELHDGNPQLLETLLPQIGIDPAMLRERNDGSAISFEIGEDESLRQAVERLLTELRVSDFLIAFPDAAAVCTVHHHVQLWWQTTDAHLFAMLEN
jgi:hypothetical protein